MKTRASSSSFVMISPVRTLLRLAVCLGALWLALPGMAWATDVGGLYKSSVAVADRSDAERKRASGEGFVQVLVRASGDSSIGTQDAVVAALKGADRFMLQYGYDTRENEAGEPEVFLNMDFDGNGVNSFLRRAGLPVWSSNRPPLLVWMAWEQELDRDLVSESANPAVYQILQQEAVRRGVGLTFPLFDTEDRAKTSIGDVWGMFPEPVLAASARYETPAILMARVKETASALQITALLHLDGQKYSFEVKQADSASGLRQLLDQVVDRMGAHYALVSSNLGSQEVVLDVENVGSLQDFAALTQYLDSVMAISLYRLHAQRADHVEFLVTLESGLDALEQVFRVDRKLVPSTVDTPAIPASAPAAVDPAAPVAADAPNVAPTGPVVVHYRWRG